MAQLQAGEAASQLDPESPVPLYHQLRLAIEAWMRRELAPGDVIPTEMEICEAYGVSRVTVREALREMTSDGVLVRPKARARPRLSSPKVHQKLNRLRGFFTDDMLAAGLEPRIIVASAAKVENARVARILELAAPAQTALYRIERLYESNQQRMAVQVSFLPVKRCPDLLSKDLTKSVSRVLDEDYHCPITSALQRVLAREAEMIETRKLGLRRHAPVIEVQRVSFTERGEPIEFFYCYLRADRYDFTMDLDQSKENSEAEKPKHRDPAWISENGSAL